jgi:hypothetical protein
MRGPTNGGRSIYIPILITLIIVSGDIPESALGGLGLLGIIAVAVWLVKVGLPVLIPVLINSLYALGSWLAGGRLVWAILGPVSYSKRSGLTWNDTWVTYLGYIDIRPDQERDARKHLTFGWTTVVLGWLFVSAVAGGLAVLTVYLLYGRTGEIPILLELPFRVFALGGIVIAFVLLLMGIVSLIKGDMPLLSLLGDGDEHRLVKRLQLVTRFENLGRPREWSPSDVEALLALADESVEGSLTLMYGYWHHVDTGNLVAAERVLTRALAQLDALPEPVRKRFFQILPSTFYEEAAWIAAYQHRDLLGALAWLNRAGAETGDTGISACGPKLHSSYSRGTSMVP